MDQLVMCVVTLAPQHYCLQVVSRKRTHHQELRGLIFVFRAGHYVLERLDAFGFEFGMRERFARKHLVAHGGIVDESGFD